MRDKLRDFLGVAPQSDASRISAYTTAAIIAAAVFLAGLVGSALFGNAISAQNASDYAQSLMQERNSLSAFVRVRIGAYNQLLYASATSLSMDDEMSTNKWREMYDALHIADDFPALVGVGYVTYLKQDEIAQFEQSMQSSKPGFKVSPLTPRGEYTVITYLQPETPENERALGFDMFSEPTRRKAMAQARDHGTVVMSDPVALVQDEGSKDPNPGVLMYYPVYQHGTTNLTQAQRRANLKGYVYMVMRPADIVKLYTQRYPDTVSRHDVAIYDKSDNDTLLYSLNNSKLPEFRKRSFTDTLQLDNQEWKIEVSGQNRALNLYIGPFLIFLFGGITSAGAGYLILRALRNRITGVEETYELEVQRTKDELLALASHQLRTPASGVKQYIGMLSQGLVGDLTPLQQEVAMKAYDANERQLEIINELLYVSKIDAGQLMIEPHRADVRAIVQKVVDQLEEDASNKEIKLVFRHKRPINAFVDERYFPMVIENLVSNAIKYSYPSTQVHLSITSSERFVSIHVRDYGVGLSPEDIPRIFLKFDRIANPLSRSEGGSGLGLFLAMELAKAHGGDITVRSKVGTGSTFTVSVPKNHKVYNAIVDLQPLAAGGDDPKRRQ